MLYAVKSHNTYSHSGEADANNEVASPVEQAGDHKCGRACGLAEELGGYEPWDGSWIMRGGW